jgi:hypothetical protein
MKIVHPFTVENNMAINKKLNMKLIYDLAISLLDTYIYNEVKTNSIKDIVHQCSW